MGVMISGVGAGIPGENVPGRVVRNETLARWLLLKRRQLVASGDLLPPDRWSELSEQDREIAGARWQQFEMDTTWLVERTGIKERRFLKDGIATSDIAVAAILDCCANAGIAPAELQSIQLATVSPDYPTTPPTSAIIHKKLGIPIANGDHLRDYFGSDITLACTSFLAALRYGWMCIASGSSDRVMVVGADKMTSTVDPLSRNLSGILADGAGAVLLTRSAADDGEAFPLGPASFLNGMDGTYEDLIIVSIGGSKAPIRRKDLDSPWKQGHRMRMAGRTVFKVASRIVQQLIVDATDRAKIKVGDIDFVAFHQANLRINEPLEQILRRRLGFTGAVWHNVQRFGNTTSGSIPIVLWEARREGALRRGMTVLAIAFGGGFSWGSSIFRWTVPDPR
jgi:3-oxoacyl-[acyl-carrier-protein] synthase-3